MRILIVGAGSVGQLYGHMLQRGGAEVDVFVRPRHTTDARRGYRLYDRREGLDEPTTFTPAGVRSAPGEIRGESYDAILLCVPATGLRGPWFEELAAAADDDATFVSLTPGPGDREYIARFVDEGRAAVGLITALAYPAPLPGEEAAEPGTAYWLPPLTPAYFDGPESRLSPLVSTLRRGGMRARTRRNLAQLATAGTATLLPMVAVLETLDWSLDALRRSRAHRELLHRATDEALEATSDHAGSRRPAVSRLLGPKSWRALLRVAPLAPPFDLEAYLRVHFTKTRDQTQEILREYVARRQRMGRASPALETLLDAGGARHAADDPPPRS